MPQGARWIDLQAETAAYPELRLVVTMHGDNLAHGETFEDAAQALATLETKLEQLRDETRAGTGDGEPAGDG